MLRVIALLLAIGLLLPALAAAEAGTQTEYRVELLAFRGDEQIPFSGNLNVLNGEFMSQIGAFSRTDKWEQPLLVGTMAVDASSDDAYKRHIAGYAYMPDMACHYTQHFEFGELDLYIYLPTADRFEAKIYQREYSTEVRSERADFAEVGWLAGSLAPVEKEFTFPVVSE